MINIEIIKENYRRMSDDQLVRFAKLEAEHLTLESFHALKDELISRDIDLQVIEELEDVDIPEKNINKAVTNTFLGSLFEFAIEKKSKGVSNAEIYHSLLEKKLAPEQAVMLIQMLPEISQKTLKATETEILIAWVAFFIGILLSLFSYNQLDVKFFVGIAVLITASIKLANSYAYKKKIVQAIDHFQQDKESDLKDLYQ